jgi:hypothetical protein
MLFPLKDESAPKSAPSEREALRRLPFHDRRSLYRGVKKPVTVP